MRRPVSHRPNKNNDCKFANFSMIDAHCHVVEKMETVGSIDQLRTRRLLLMSTKKKEWDLVAKVAGSRHIPCFGIHPWFADQHTSQDLLEIKKLLIDTPTSIIGEIGLDTVAVDSMGEKYSWETQLEIFKSMMNMAIELHKPVSIHAVKSFGILIEYFVELDKRSKHTDIAVPSIMMHSFSGSLEVLKRILKLKTIGPKFYFSYSDTINSRSNKTLAKIKATPNDRILVESDIGDALLVDKQMESAIEMIALAKDWDTETAIRITMENTQRFLGLGEK